MFSRADEPRKRIPRNRGSRPALPDLHMSTATHSLPAQYSQLEIKSILLLDDDTDLADALKELLESRNFVVTTASDGVDGLREVMRLDFDVIICDMLMPRMPRRHVLSRGAKDEAGACATASSSSPATATTRRSTTFSSSIDALVLFKPVLIEELWA